MEHSEQSMAYIYIYRLKMPHIQSFYKALKMSWLHKLLDTFNHSPWKVLLLDYIQKWGGSNILFLIRRFHLCGMALRILKYSIKFNLIL
jgi:hypothetical protein